MCNVYGNFMAYLFALWSGFLPWLFSRVFRGLSLLLVRSVDFLLAIAYLFDQWMARYESLAEFFGYTSVQMVEELQAVLEGQAFSWYILLQRTIKKDSVALKGKFCYGCC
ncbi:hypothetical protein BC941DRAFT_471661 [Chlamydoabsidia padenii]|nr:hypothetical protein BC941DRAFT_471661 [Chlamydoabsidia padenii]